MKALLASLPALVAAALAAGCASSTGGREDGPRWYDDTVHGALLGYGWNSDVDADGRAGGFSASTDEHENTTIGGGRLEAGMQQVSLLLDAFWLHAGTVESGVEADVRYGRFDLSVAMRIHGQGRLPLEEREGPVSTFVDGIAGIRSHFADLTADPPGFEEYDEDVAWLEPMAGARAGVTILRRITVYGRADVGGIAYEGFSSSSWGAEVGLQVDVIGGLGVVAGSRWARIRFDEDADDDGFDEASLDMTLQGLWAGIVLQF